MTDTWQHDHNGPVIAAEPAPPRKPRTPKTAYDGPPLADLIVEHKARLTHADLNLLDALDQACRRPNNTARDHFLPLAADPAQPLAVRLLPAALAGHEDTTRTVLQLARAIAKAAR